MVDYSGTVAIPETFRGQVVWDGLVDVFELRKHPPKFVYGWTVQPGRNGEAFEHVTVLGTPPIDSPLAAVRAWILSQAKQ
jgi:hypothetical protein